MKKTNRAKKIKIPEIDGEEEILVVRVGSDERPAGPKDLENMQKSLSQLRADDSLTLVTHHCVDFAVLKKKFFKGNVCIMAYKSPEDFLSK